MSATPTRRPRILILDDRLADLETFRMLLEIEGYEVTLTSSPFTLPFVIRQHDPDLVLIDLNMPVLSGKRIFQMIPRTAIRSDAPLVLFSGCGVEELAHQTRLLGADGYIDKGADAESTLKQIRWFLEIRKQKAESRNDSGEGGGPRPKAR